jgi:hypothetical protein
MIEEYQKLAEMWESIDYSSKSSVRKCNKASDRMRQIIAQAESQGPDAIRAFLPLLEIEPANKWLAHHLVELATIDRETEDRCFAIVKDLAITLKQQGKGADARGEDLWLKERKAKKNRA